MALNAHKLLQGPARIYVAAFGATEPTSALTGGTLAVPNPATWKDFGLTLGGTTFSMATDYSALEADQILDRAGSAPTSRTISVETTMAELTLDNLVVGMNGGTYTPGDEDTASIWEPIYDEDAFAPDFRAILLSGWGPRGDDGLKKRRYVIIRKVLSTDGLEINFAKEDQSTAGVTFMGHFVSESVAPVRVLEDPETD